MMSVTLTNCFLLPDIRKSMPDKVHSLILPKRLPTSWAGHVAQKEEIRNAYKIVVEKPQGKRTFVRPRHKWEVKGKVVPVHFFN